MVTGTGRSICHGPRKFFLELVNEIAEFAKHQFWLNSPISKDSNLTRYDHLTNIAKQTGEDPPELTDGPDLPEVVSYIWEWFLELHTSREAGKALSFNELESWARLTGRHVMTWEINAIKRMDLEYLQQIK